MEHPYPVILFAVASTLSGVAFGDIPEKKQKNPGIAACRAADTAVDKAAGIAITEEGGPNQHADRPKKPKGIAVNAPGSEDQCPDGSTPDTRRTGVPPKP